MDAAQGFSNDPGHLQMAARLGWPTCQNLSGPSGERDLLDVQPRSLPEAAGDPADRVHVSPRRGGLHERQCLFPGLILGWTFHNRTRSSASSDQSGPLSFWQRFHASRACETKPKSSRASAKFHWASAGRDRPPSRPAPTSRARIFSEGGSVSSSTAARSERILGSREPRAANLTVARALSRSPARSWISARSAKALGDCERAARWISRTSSRSCILSTTIGPR